MNTITNLKLQNLRKDLVASQKSSFDHLNLKEADNKQSFVSQKKLDPANSYQTNELQASQNWLVRLATYMKETK